MAPAWCDTCSLICISRSLAACRAAGSPDVIAWTSPVISPAERPAAFRSCPPGPTTCTEPATIGPVSAGPVTPVMSAPACPELGGQADQAGQIRGTARDRRGPSAGGLPYLGP